MFYTNYGGPNLGKGPYNGHSPVQTTDCYKTAEDAGFRKVLTKSWNGVGAVGIAIGNGETQYKRVTTPFRAVDNSGDFLARNQYVCGGPNAVGRYRPGCYIRSGLTGATDNCDGTGVEGASCNPKFVHDSSDYVKYRKLRAINQNYNDLSNGGYTNSAYVPLMRVRGRRRVAP